MGVNAEAPQEKGEGEENAVPTREVILDRPVHDTGNALYAILSFFLPILGIIAAYLFRRKNYIRNYKACRKGVLAAVACLGAGLLLFAFFIIMAVV